MVGNDARHALDTVPLFEGVASDTLDSLAERAHLSRTPRNTNLVALQQPGEVVYVLLEGTVRVQVGQPDGTMVILAYLGPGDLVGEMGVVEGSRRSATVVALESCRLLWIDRKTFNDCMREAPRLAFNVAGMLSRRLRLANERIQLLCTHDVPGRLARQLAAFAAVYGDPGEDGVRIPLRLTQSDLADIVGASRERVNRVMVEMRRRDELEVDGSYRITVRDPEAFSQRYG